MHGSSYAGTNRFKFTGLVLAISAITATLAARTPEQPPVYGARAGPACLLLGGCAALQQDLQAASAGTREKWVTLELAADLADPNQRLAARRAAWAREVFLDSVPGTKLQVQACVLDAKAQRGDQPFDRRIAVEWKLADPPRTAR